jgi:hypothetical protein
MDIEQDIRMIKMLIKQDINDGLITDSITDSEIVELLKAECDIEVGE